MGCCAGPDDVYQVLRGLRTMGVRLERHQKSALDIARWLETQPGVARVLHPGLESHPGPRALEARLFRRQRHLLGRACRRRPEGRRTPSSTRCGSSASAIPGAAIESLAVHVFLGDRTIAKGPYEGPLIRLQIGLEDVEDLKGDLLKGLEAARPAESDYALADSHQEACRGLPFLASTASSSLVAINSSRSPTSSSISSSRTPAFAACGGALLGKHLGFLVELDRRLRRLDLFADPFLEEFDCLLGHRSPLATRTPFRRHQRLSPKKNASTSTLPFRHNPVG